MIIAEQVNESRAVSVFENWKLCRKLLFCFVILFFYGFLYFMGAKNEKNLYVFLFCFVVPYLLGR